MRTALLLPSLCLLQSAFAAIHPLSDVSKATNLAVVPGKFIVEVDDSAHIPNSRRGLSARAALYSSLTRRGVDFNVTKEFDASGIFVGAALTLSDAQDAKQLMETEGVLAVHPITKFSRPKPVSSHVVTGATDPALPPDTESTHILTGVDKLHAQGITGAGVKIGILDTGVDYTHPALGGGFGPGFKVSGGTDLVGDAYDGTNQPMPDPDPLDQCEGHGTHVAGIIGADPGNEFNISGVAFGASLSAYRIFGCEGFVTDDVIIEALLLGVSDGQDILTLSLGGADGWTESASSVVASRIADTGKIVTIAAGNDGASGSWYTSSPGNGISVISVASLDNTVLEVQTATVHGADHAPIPYFDLFPIPVTETLPIFATSNDTTVVDDACDPLPDDTPDLSGFLVVVRRGTCSFVQKLTNIAAKGGNLTFIYDNGSGFSAIDVGTFNATLIRAEDGEFLVSEFAAGVDISISFPQTGGATQLPDPTGGLISSFTSYGPTNDFFFKPALAAPGGNILSTFPVPLGSFAILSGTSMATPFVAGSAALLFEVKGKDADVGRGARSLFQSTAQTIASNHTDAGPLQTATQQGAGLINVFDALTTTTIVSPTELLLNDTAHFAGVQKFTVTNEGNETKDYTLSHVPAGTAMTIQPDSIFAELGPVPLTSDQVTISLDPSDSFTLSAGQSQTVTATFTLPASVDPSVFPVFSGFIHVTSGNDSLHASYLGVGAALKDKQVVDNTDEFFGVTIPVVLDPEGNVQEGAMNYTFGGTDFPTLLWRMAFGTPVFRVDLVDANTTFQPTLNTPDASTNLGRRAPLITFPDEREGGSFADVDIVGSMLEVDWLGRNNEDDNPSNTVGFANATFANGSTIPNGSYRFLIRSLRVTGDPENEDDYESWLSPVVGVEVVD